MFRDAEFCGVAIPTCVAVCDVQRMLTLVLGVCGVVVHCFDSIDLLFLLV